MWVRLKTVYYIEEGGRNVTKRPGDWVNVSKSQALMLIARNQAEIPTYTDQAESIISTDHAGLVCVGGEVPESFLDDLHIAIQNRDDPTIIFQLNLVWQPTVVLRMELIPVGLHLLDTWEIVVPMWDYNELARDVGTDKDRARVASVVRDLRVPLYDCRLIYARRCTNTEQLFEYWNKLRADGMEDKLAFLMALYRVKPLVLPVPLTWTGRNG